MDKGYLGIMVDCSRNAVLNMKGIKRLVDVMQKMGYNMLMLYTEDTYEVDNQPMFGYLRGRYTKEEMKEAVAYAESKGIEMIPCIQTLAHLNQIFRWKEYREIWDCEDILLAENDRTYAFIEDMFKTLRECYKTNRIHLGMDEAFKLGKGKYREKYGEKKGIEILKKHLYRVADIAKKYGFCPMIWSDMFCSIATNGVYVLEKPVEITPEIAAMVPDNVEPVYWNYFTGDKETCDKMLNAHKNFNKPVWFAGGALTWTGFTAHNGMAIKYSDIAMRSCRENGVNNVIMTCWGDNGGEASVFSVLPALFHAAEVLRGNDDEELIKTRFKNIIGVDFDDYMKLDLPCSISELYAQRTLGPDRMFAYNDPFTGICDSLVEQFPDIENTYREHCETLKKLENTPEYGYLFRSAAALCDFLSVKSDLGLKIRAAYKSGDRDALIALAERISFAEEKLEAFYSAYRKAWLKDKKGAGFEIQDIRLGGLKMRLADCRMRINEYLDGEYDKIDDLEQELVAVYDKAAAFWDEIVTVNAITTQRVYH